MIRDLLTAPTRFSTSLFLIFLAFFSSQSRAVRFAIVSLSLLLCPKSLPTVSFSPFSLLGIRLPWTPPRPCSSWWQRRACPACPPAWGRFIPATGMLTASSTSPTPRRICSEHLTQQPGHPAEPGAHTMNWTRTTGGDTTQLNWENKNKLSPDCFCPVFLSPKLHFSLPHEPFWTFSCSATSARSTRLTLMMSLF